MMYTEIQTISGGTELPTGWPKLEFGEFSTGLIHDWNASSLAVGDLPSTGWVSYGTTPATLKTSGNTPAPKVVLDPINNKKYIRFTDNQMTAAVSWTSDTTILYVIRPDVITGNQGRALSGLNGNFRGFITSGSNIEMTQSTSKGGTRTGIIASGLGTRRLTTFVGRWGATEFSGKEYGGAVKSFEGAEHPQQKIMVIGANTSNPPIANTFLKADVFRIMVWNRVLTDIDVETALAANAREYGISKDLV